MKNVIGFVVVLALAVGIRFYNRGEDDQKIKNEAKELISQLDFYAADAEYIDGLIDDNHTAAFDASYTMGGRRTASKFDQDKYLAELFHRMAGDAFKAGKRELGQALNRAEEIAKEPSKE